MSPALLRRAPTARALLAVAACCLGPACGEEPAPPPASPSPRAVLLLEPPELGIGDVAVVELAVVTPPGYHARPFEPPPELPGFWLLDAATLPVEKRPTRWLHRTRVRIRARETGHFAWPAGSVAIESPDGELAELPVEALPLEVTSVRPSFPERRTPFGARRLPAPSDGGSRWSAAAGGAAAALAGVALVAWGRRRLRRRRRWEAPPLDAPEPPWRRVRGELREAGAVGAGDPLAAAHLLAGALRRYMAGRFGADAVARTTEELEASAPPFGATSRWPTFLAILRGLDEFRFLPLDEAADRPALSERVGALLARAEAFVAETMPEETRR
jgi:hypothetical protein